MFTNCFHLFIFVLIFNSIYSRSFFFLKKLYLLLLLFIIIILWTNVLWNENTVSLLSKCWFTICNIVLNFTAFLENGPSFWIRLVLKRSDCVNLILNKREKNCKFRFKRTANFVSKETDKKYRTYCIKIIAFSKHSSFKKNQLKFESQNDLFVVCSILYAKEWSRNKTEILSQNHS